MSEGTNGPTNLDEEARRRLKRWMTSSELQEYMQQSREASAVLDRVRSNITISRAAGAGAPEIARLVGAKLGWDVLDKELLDFMAERYQLSRNNLDFVDESQANWLYDVFGAWFDARVVSHEKYLVHLEQIIWLAAVHGRVVIVGRGAQFILPPRSGLSVRLTAPLEFRVRQVMQRNELAEEDAKQYIERADAGRRDFVQRYLHHDIEDPNNYDVVIDVADQRPEDVADRIVSEHQQRYAS